MIDRKCWTATKATILIVSFTGYASAFSTSLPRLSPALGIPFNPTSARISRTTRPGVIQMQSQQQESEIPVGEVSIRHALSGPGDPVPVPRTVTQVVSYSVPTALGWYGWYKFCVEEELKERFSYLPWYRRLGGRWTLGPFVIGLTVPQVLTLALGDSLPEWFPALSLLGVAWIYAVQLDLYLRINLMAKENGFKEPLQPLWVFVPVLFNLIVGLRQVHWLAKLNALEKDLGDLSDPLADIFPFIKAEVPASSQNILAFRQVHGI
mmetsp:Transcript_18272/g.28410  ORF Transcript_18272/g.28410 Transcript_18272/m.28410 type:complete len:265 (-) Transcript_18272:1113-1907(-)